MNQPKKRNVKLYLRDDLSFLPIVQALIENTGLSFGLDAKAALALTLAGEEIFNYLCTNIKPETEIKLRCSDGIYYTQLDFSLPLHNLPLRAFNLTATIDVEDETSLEEMGLVIASRMVDKLEISKSRSGRITLSLRKEKSYPKPADKLSLPPPQSSKDFNIIIPDDEELKFFVNLCANFIKPEFLPAQFNYPGKIVDMTRAGDLKAAIIRDAQGRIGGGITWFWSSAKMVECHGPYIPDDPETDQIPEQERREKAEALLDFCLNAIAKSPAVGLINRNSGPDLPQSYFEPLGSVSDYNNKTDSLEIPALFRHMQEDPGAIIWTHPEFADFLQRECQRLALPREIRLTGNSGEKEAEFSVLGSEFYRSQNRVTLRPLWAGQDMKKNIADHLELFSAEMIENIFFIIDLGQSWQAKFAPALKENNFSPRLVLPYGGNGDLLILQKMMPER